jgi:hypothetical protein
MSLMVSSESKPQHTFDSAEMGVIAHLYRGEVYRSTIWRTRLDNTTNWSIVTMGIALSTTFSSPEASPLPLVLVGLLLAVFLGMEARRYRYFNVWRARARWLEMNFYAPIFTGEARDDSWQVILARDYTVPRHHILFVRGRGGGCVATTSGFSHPGNRLLRQDSHPSDACGDPGRIFRSRRRRTDSRLDRSDDRLCLLFRLAGVRARHDVARPTPARQGQQGGDGLSRGWAPAKPAMVGRST